jgi:endonuclease/exonuclease/phosphatase (EEP) superfamily protein YafD
MSGSPGSARDPLVDTPWNLKAPRSVERRMDLDRRRRIGRSRIHGRRTRRRMRHSTVGAVGATLGAAATTAVLLPDRIGVGHRFPGVALAALRPHGTAAAIAAAALLAVPRPTRALAAGIGSAALVSAVSLLSRARALDAARVSTDLTDLTDLTVLTANVLVGSADTGALATLIERESPDLVSLPEAGPDFRDKLLPLIAGLGYRAWASSAPGTSDGEGVVLLVADRMGDVTVTTGHEMRHRYLRATGGALRSRRFYAVHPEAPVTPERTTRWRADLAHIARWCEESPAPIVAGDFNATADNGLFRAALGRCHSAADGSGLGLVGTFPARLPSWCGIQIDHVLVPLGATTTRFTILPIAGSDHRAVLAAVSLPPE